MATTTAPHITGIHLVGSFPLPSASETFTTLAAALGPHLKRLPDGEPGERFSFAFWQSRVIKKYPILFNPMVRKMIGVEPDEHPLTDDIKRRTLEQLRSGDGQLEPEYDSYALQSYEHFARLKSEGIIPAHVKFLVCLPTAVSVTCLFIRSEFQVEFEPIYEAALIRSLRRIQENIPHDQLSIQWDAPLDLAMVEGSDFYGRGWAEQYFKGDAKEGVVQRWAKLVDAVDERVEVGLHLCYGDIGHKHFIQPKDTTLLTDMSRSVLAQTKRHIDFIHLPMPKDRTDAAYLEPLRALRGKVEDGLEISLGLVHPFDLEGTRDRIKAAGTVISKFSISTECGLGRSPKEEFESVLDVFASVAS